MSIDRRAVNVLLAVLRIGQRDLAERMGYRTGYVVNVLNGCADASPAFRIAFADAIADLLLGTNGRSKERYPARPLAELIRRRAEEASRKHQFYADLGISPHGWNKRDTVSSSLVDRICCALGVHPSSIYGRDYDLDDVS